MKACKLSLLLLLISFGAFAQEEEETKKGGFKTENIFVGGGIGLGSGSVFGNSGFGGGGSFFFSISPQAGYSLAKWLDLGLEITYSYRTASDGVNGFSASTFGVGPFVRIFPIEQFYLMAQPEFNSVKVSFNGGGSQTASGNSFLAGGGYISGGSNSYFFTSILFDFGNSQFSPYKLENGTKLPIIRSGIVFHLGGGSSSSSSPNCRTLCNIVVSLTCTANLFATTSI
jgi:hypothetical protein